MKARSATATPAPGPQTIRAISGPVTVPEWKIGDEWRYAFKSPTGSGTFVWAVQRFEELDGAQHYVIKSGTREILYRVADLASSLERVDGKIVVRHSPPRLSFSWPLNDGKTWEQSHTEERPVDRTTTNRTIVWTVEGEETVTVLAGTFRALRITFRNKNTGALGYEMWYAPEAKQWVKIREILSNGTRERELASYKLK